MVTMGTLELACLGSNPSSSTCQLCSLRQVNEPLWALVSPSDQ